MLVVRICFFLKYIFYQLENIYHYLLTFMSFYYEWALDFVKCFLCIFWYHHEISADYIREDTQLDSFDII